MKYVCSLEDEIANEQKRAQFKINGKRYVRDKIKELLPDMDKCEKDQFFFEIKNIFKEMQQDEGH